MSNTFDISLYLVLDTSLCSGLDNVLATAQAALDEGITMLQLRSEHMTGREWIEVGTPLKQLLTAYSVPLIINNRLDLALALEADGVHMGQKDLPPHLVRKILGPDKILGLSISTLAELASVPVDLVDYLGIGPVFPTTSKQNTAPPLGIEGLKHMVQHKQTPAVGIGGVTPMNITQVLSTGIEGVGVVSAICGQKSPAEATRKLKEQLLTPQKQPV